MTSISIHTPINQDSKVKEYLKPVLTKLNDYGVATSVIDYQDVLVPKLIGDGKQIEGLRNIRSYLAKMEKELRPSGKRRIPNSARTVEGKWYKFQGQFKITETTKPYYKDGSKAYRITIGGFPSKHRVGMIPQEVVIVDHDPKEGRGGASYFYDVSEKDVRDDIFKLIDAIKTNHFEVEEQAKVLESKLTPHH